MYYLIVAFILFSGVSCKQRKQGSKTKVNYQQITQNVQVAFDQLAVMDSDRMSQFHSFLTQLDGRDVKMKGILFQEAVLTEKIQSEDQWLCRFGLSEIRSFEPVKKAFRQVTVELDPARVQIPPILSDPAVPVIGIKVNCPVDRSSEIVIRNRKVEPDGRVLMVFDVNVSYLPIELVNTTAPGPEIQGPQAACSQGQRGYGHLVPDCATFYERESSLLKVFEQIQ